MGDTAELAVDAARRRAIMRNHSATHLLHAALRQVLGAHVRQAGSLVAPDRLRFDFLHPRALTEDQAEQVERLVNAEVLDDVERTTVVKPYADAIRDGAIAFFGDAYGDDVRVVSFGGFSAELCGGTHVRRTAEVGLFRIVSEGSIGAGVRRIEAVTGEAAVARTLERDRLLRGLAARLRVSVDQLPQRVEALAARGRAPASRTAGPDAGTLAGSVRTAPSGQRYLVVSDAGLGPAGLPGQAGRLAASWTRSWCSCCPAPGTTRCGSGSACPPRWPGRSRRPRCWTGCWPSPAGAAAAVPCSPRAGAPWRGTCPRSSPGSGGRSGWTPDPWPGWADR